MDILKKKSIKISNDTFKKICRDLKIELKENKNEIEKLNKLDYEYNKKVVYLDRLIERIDFYKEKKIIEKETYNNVVSYYGDPCNTIDIILSAILNCQLVNILIEDICLGVNKLIVTLYQEILKEYKLYDIVSLNSSVSKNDIEKQKEIIDYMYFLGNKNFYLICKNIDKLNMQYIPFNNIDIYCENEELYDLSKEIFNVCFENGIESEIYDEMEIDEVIKILNNYGEKYCSVILTKDKNKAELFKEKVKSKYVIINENPFNANEIFENLPEIF